MLRSNSKQSGESMQSVLKKKRERLRWEGLAEKEGFKPGTKCEGVMAISTRVYFAKNVTEIIFPFSSWLSFQRLCRLLWVLHLCAPYIFMIIYIFYISFPFQFCHRLILF